MNEEIVVGMALSTTKFSKGIRTAKSALADLKGDADKLKESFKAAFTGAALAVFAAKIAQVGKAIMDYADRISDLAENTNSTTDFVQQLGYGMRKNGEDAAVGEKGLEKLAIKIGDARSGSAEAAKAFDQWGIALNDANGKANNTDQIVAQISKRMNEIEDPTLRARMAFDLFSKSGFTMIETLRELDAVKSGSKGKIISEDTLAQLADAKKNMSGLFEWAKVLGAKGMGALAVSFGIADPSAKLTAYYKSIQNGTANFTPEDPEAAKKAKDYAAALADLNKARRDSNRKAMAEWLQIASLMTDAKEVEAAMLMQKEGTIERLKLEKDLLEKNGEIAKRRADLEKKAAEDKVKAEKEETELLKKKEAMVKSINDSYGKYQDKQHDLNEAKRARGQYTVDELAGANGRFGGQIGQDQRISRQIKWWENALSVDKSRGNTDAIHNIDLPMIDKLRSQLSNNLLESERQPFKNLEEAMNDAANANIELLKRATKEGLIVIPRNGQ